MFGTVGINRNPYDGLIGSLSNDDDDDNDADDDASKKMNSVIFYKRNSRLS